MGNIDDAAEDIDIALDVAPDNINVIKAGAQIAIRLNNFKKAITLLERIDGSHEASEVKLLLINAYAASKNYIKATEQLGRFLRTETDSKLLIEAKRLLTHVLIDAGNFDEAIRNANQMLEYNPNNLSFMMDLSRATREKGETVYSKDIQKKAKLLVTNGTSKRQMLELADEFYASQEYEDAANLYSSIISDITDSPITDRLLDSYYLSGNLEKTLEICRCLREQKQPEVKLTIIESSILEKIGDMPGAKKVYEMHLERFPEDIDVLLNYAFLEYRLDNIEKVDELLAKVKFMQHLPLITSLNLAEIYSLRSRYKDAIDVAYETRRTYYNDERAHLKYINIFLGRHSKETEEWLHTQIVKKNTAIKVTVDGKEEVYIIEDRDDIYFESKEININHFIAKNALGKGVGDEVIMKKNYLAEEKGIINEILSKYVFAFQETSANFERLFPNAGGIWGFNIKSKTEHQDVREEFAPLFIELERSDKRTNNALEFYRKGNLTVGALANILGKSIIEIWNRFSFDESPKLRFSNGKHEELRDAFDILTKNPKIILDPTAIITIMTNDEVKKAIDGFSELVVSQSTRDVFRREIEKWKRHEETGLESIGQINGKLFREKLSIEQVKNNIKYLEDVINWVKSKCKVMPCYGGLKLNSKEKEDYDHKLGESFIDSILIAQENKDVLFSDDERLRSYAKNEFQVEAVWTEPILHLSLRNNQITNDDFTNANISLIIAGYRFVSIRAEELVEALRKANYLPKPPFSFIAQTLAEPNTNLESAIMVSINFIYALWQIPLSITNRDNLLINYLDMVMPRDIKAKYFIAKLRAGIKMKMHLLPIASIEVINIINVFEKNKIII